MELVLAAVEDDLAEAWRHFCGDLEFVRVHHGSILEVACDAVVSPANSFGFMDGGIDGVYRRHFGRQIQDHVQRAIRERHHGELVVGEADVVPTGNAGIPYLIAAPTMRVPMMLGDTVNPYLAARAVFRLVKDGSFAEGAHHGERIGEHIHTVALPGLGTGVGGVGSNTCAHQVRAAIDDILLGGFTPPQTLLHAGQRHSQLIGPRRSTDR